MFTYIYRVQNSEGQGPYCGCGGFINFETVTHNTRTGRPRPSDDGINLDIVIKQSELFGFIDLDSAQAWFWPEELRRLDTYGFKLTRVKGIIKQIGEKQVTFIRG